MAFSRYLAPVFSFLALCGLLIASPTTTPVQEQGLTGAGSTFINPIMSHWIADFQSRHPGVQINYQSIGSGGGIQQLKKGLVDFGASDAALNDEQLKEMPPLVQIPESAGPVCITYNLPDLKSPLRLSPAVLAGIYLGTIKTWQDPQIRTDNPGVNLPKTAIVVAHRSDGSGTTNIFTTYLAAVSPQWEKKVGKGLAVSWPVGVGGKGSEGVTGSAKQMQGGNWLCRVVVCDREQVAGRADPEPSGAMDGTDRHRSHRSHRCLS
jgi:phosphate transport system substrate-binding protein